MTATLRRFLPHYDARYSLLLRPLRRIDDDDNNALLLGVLAGHWRSSSSLTRYHRTVDVSATSFFLSFALLRLLLVVADATVDDIRTNVRGMHRIARHRTERERAIIPAGRGVRGHDVGHHRPSGTRPVDAQKIRRQPAQGATYRRTHVPRRGGGCQ